MNHSRQSPSRSLHLESPAALERALREFAREVVIAAPARARDARERCFAEASAIHQSLMAQRLLQGVA